MCDQSLHVGPNKDGDRVIFQPDAFVPVSKPLIPVDALDATYRGYLPGRGYTLCLGAGISRGIAPTWIDLAREIINEVFGTGYDEQTFERIVSSSAWSLDAWIQIAANELLTRGKTIADIDYLIESKLYAKVRTRAKGLGLEKYLTQVLNSPTSAPRNRVIDVWDFIQSAFSDSSLLKLVRFLISAAKREKAPRAILTFNADTFLETAIDLALRSEHYLGPGPHGHPTYYFVAVTRPGQGAGTKIPIFHCHGAIAPSAGASGRHLDGRDRLVFLESEYLAAASRLAMWSQTVFMYYAQSTKLAFVGMSMSDSNIRRWMSAVDQEKSRDRTLLRAEARVNPEHIWISVRPADAAERRINLVSQTHLGVRPAWIGSWKDLELALRNLPALRD